MQVEEQAPAVASGEMSPGTLAERVSTARAERGWSLSALQRASGLSPRTLRDIEAGSPNRRYGTGTLARLDETFGWRPGTAYDTWRRDETDQVVLREAIAAQMAALDARLARIEEAPPWQSELVDAVRLLRPDDRARVLDYARRLGETATWR